MHVAMIFLIYDALNMTLNSYAQAHNAPKPFANLAKINEREQKKANFFHSNIANAISKEEERTKKTLIEQLLYINLFDSMPFWGT